MMCRNYWIHIGEIYVARYIRGASTFNNFPQHVLIPLLSVKATLHTLFGTFLYLQVIAVLFIRVTTSLASNKIVINSTLPF